MSDSQRDERVCHLTDTPVENDCYTKISFGYGSTLDRHNYRFVMCDEIGQKVLRYIESLYTNGKTLQDNKTIDEKLY